jgi:probable rRNA maturation factor
MNYTINVQVKRAYAGRVPVKVIRDSARAALAHQRAPAPGALTIRLTGDAALRQLNRDYLGHDEATDVLSFPSDERDEGGARYLGDLAISVPRAAAQARAGGHPLKAELQLLVVHGILHLLGHDHARARDQRRMWAAQAEILAQLKASIAGPAPGNARPT